MRITVDQQLPIHANPLTAKGRTATIDGEVKWSSSDDTVATVVSTGPYSAMVKPTGKPGMVKVTATFDADMGEGVRQVVAPSDPIDIVEAEATSASIEFGAPEAATGEEAEEEPAPTPIPETPPPVEPAPPVTPPPSVEEPTPPVEPTPVLKPWEQPLTLVNVPEGTTIPKLIIGDAIVKAKEFGAKGDGQTNDTASLIAAVKALPASGGTLWLEGPAEYMVDASEVAKWTRSNFRIYWEDGAWLNPIPNNDDRAYAILLQDVIHVELYNQQIRGERLKHIFTTFPPITQSDGTTKPSSRDTHEWGHNIAVRGKSQYINILLGHNREANGDGISCGGSDIFIYGVEFDANRRQGVTLGSAKNSKVLNCVMSNTGDYQTSQGTQPQGGIDIEPDAPNDSRNNVVYGNRIFGNRVGIEVYANPTPNAAGDYAEVLELYLKNNEVYGNVIGISITGAKAPVITGNNIHDNETLGLKTGSRVVDMVLGDNTFKNNSTRLGAQKPRNFDLKGTSTAAATSTTRDIQLGGTPAPVNTTYPEANHFR